MSRTIFVLSLLLSVHSPAAIEIRDDRGVVVRLAAPATRLVTLAPNLAEIAYAAGAGDKLVGVSRFSSLPEPALRLPRVGDAARVDLERIVTLRPDLVLAWKSGNRPRDVTRLEQLGIPVFVTEPSRLNDLPRLLRAVGALAGTAAAADQAASKFSIKINELKDFYGGRQPLRVFYEIWHHPLLTVNGKHMISDVLTLCGGRNVFARAPALTPAVSIEAVLATRPDVVLGGDSAENERNFVAQWRTSVVRELRDLPVFYIAPDIIQRPTPRILEGARTICEDLEQVRKNRRKSRSH